MNVRAISSVLFALFAAQSALAAGTAPDGFAVYTVGGDAGCAYTSIQDAIDAAKAHPGEDYIFIAQNLTYTEQQLVVTDDDVIIEGGFPNCGVFDPGDATTRISGTSGHSIFEIEGNSTVFLWNMELTGASMDSSHKGGAIYFGGAGSLSLKNDWIHDNTSGYGGAFAINPSGPTSVSMLKNLIIGPNTALVQGGAIRIEGQTTVTAGWNAGEQPIYIGGNQALGQGDSAAGGGIQIVGPASFNGSARIHDNTADYGGGIAMYAHDGDTASVNLYTTDAGNPVQVASNHAGNIGGGIYIKSSDQGAIASLCANDFSIDANTAANGSAIYADEDNDHGSAVYLNSTLCPRPPSGVACAAGPLCNEIDDNIASDAGSAAVLIQSSGVLFASRFAARRNQAGRLIELIADTQLGSVILDDCLLADNSLTSNLLWGDGGAADTNLFVHSCTLTHNQLGSTDPVVYANVSRLEITDSIIDQPQQVDSLAFTGSADNLFTQYVLTNDTRSFVNGPGILAGAPLFVDAANADYHLQRSSPGIDEAPAIDGVDLDGNPRSFDLPDIANDFGPTDLGAYEIQTLLPPPACAVADTIYCNGFEMP
ncbi:MAG: hypothetical protein ABI843_00910 [Dokdonella sp.]